MAIKLCPNGGKVGYLTERQAFDTRNMFFRRYKLKKTLAVYVCPYCHLWHLTHHRPRKKK